MLVEQEGGPLTRLKQEAVPADVSAVIVRCKVAACKLSYFRGAVNLVSTRPAIAGPVDTVEATKEKLRLAKQCKSEYFPHAFSRRSHELGMWREGDYLLN